jgi:hypothetical protein
VVPTVFHRASLFRPSWVGAWTYYVIAAVAVALVLGAAVLLIASGRALGFAGAASAVAVVAFLNAGVWSLVTPAFQPPDEASHYAYVESLVERGETPSTSPTGGGEGSYTRGAALAIERTAVGVVQNKAGKPPWTREEERSLDDAEAALGRHAEEGGGGYTSVAGYSPLYYAAEAIPYAAGNDIFTRLWLMRLLSALMIAGAAAFSFLFARELAPSIPWAAPVAGLAVAFEPMLAFMGGAVNNDALLFLLASAELYLLARALRRGLGTGLALAIGAVLGLGIAAKPNMFAFVPVAALVMGWILWRSDAPRPVWLRWAAAAAGAFAVVMMVRYALFAQNEAIAGTFDTNAESRPFTLRDFLSYVWQWYLPPLPFMEDRFAGPLPVYDVYFKGLWAPVSTAGRGGARCRCGGSRAGARSAERGGARNGLRDGDRLAQSLLARTRSVALLHLSAERAPNGQNEVSKRLGRLRGQGHRFVGERLHVLLRPGARFIERAHRSTLIISE